MNRQPRNRKLWALYASLAVLTTAAVAADKGSLGFEVNGIPVTETESAPGKKREESKVPTREACMTQCFSADTKCSSEVRRARSDCSKNAANAGRSPYTMRNDNDMSYFCSYFENPGFRCGSGMYSRGCQARLSQRYGLCIDAMNNNIADMRNDCFRSERAAQNFCRDELSDCKAAC